MSEEMSKNAENTADNDNKSNTSNTEEVKSTRKLLGNSLGVRAREDIYNRFDKQSKSKEDEKSDTSSEKEESKTEKDLKENSGTEQHSDNVSEDTEKSTSVKKGKEPKVDSDDQKKVPLQALHEARERFRKLNLEYRDYKDNQEKEIKDLKVQLQKLQEALKSGSTTTENDFAEEENEKVTSLRRELAEMKKKYEVDESEKAKEVALKAQQELQKKVEKVTKELAEEGYPGFDIAILRTDIKLREMANSGDITESEMADPNVWKKVYKEHVYSEAKKVFSEQDKQETMDRKKEAKKKANLIVDPGKAPEKPKKEDETPISYDEFVKQGVAERMDDFKKKFYKRK